MASLSARDPNVPNIAMSPGIEEGAWRQLEPYRDWSIAQLDMYSTDMLIMSPDEKRLVLLSGHAVTLWYSLRQSAAIR
jgi:hypothetical protein